MFSLKIDKMYKRIDLGNNVIVNKIKKKEGDL